MSTEQKIKIFLVDDDALFLRSLEIEFLELEGIIVETYATGELCIENLDHRPDIIVLDYHLNGIDQHAINGIETLDKIQMFNSAIPVIMLSSQDSIEVAINCIHHHAYDYVVKSSTAFYRIQKIINVILECKKIKTKLDWYIERM